MKEKELEFSDNVIIIDVDFVYNVYNDMTKHMSKEISANMKEFDLPAFVYALAHNFNLSKTENLNDVNVVFITESLQKEYPLLNIKKRMSDYDGMGLDLDNYSFTFMVAPYENLTTSDELFIDLARLTLDSKTAKNIILVGREGDNLENFDKQFNKYTETLKEGKATKKEVSYFTMAENSDDKHYRQRLMLENMLLASGVVLDRA